MVILELEPRTTTINKAFRGYALEHSAIRTYTIVSDNNNMCYYFCYNVWQLMGIRVTSHLTVRLTTMPVTVNGISSHLCKIWTLILVKTYLQTGRRPYHIAGRPVVACYNSAKPPQTSKSVSKRPKTHSFSAGRTSLYNWDNANFSAWAHLFFSSKVLKVKMILHNTISGRSCLTHKWEMTLICSPV